MVAKGKGPRQRVCRLLNVARSTSYYKQHARAVTVDEVLAQRIKHMIDAEPYLGYRMVWARLRMQGFTVNRKAVQRIMQDDQFVWGVALNPEAQEKFKAARPELFAPGSAAVKYPVINAGFVIYSSICPHLGCRVKWFPDKKEFICPCHGSKYNFDGVKTYGPAPRGLDPLPLREKDGTAQITWIQYKGSQPDRVIIAYS